MSTKLQTLLVATNNQGKVRELSNLLKDTSFMLKSLADFPDIVEVDETGLTFGDNARLKAAGYAVQTCLPALADDSGLEVEALGGRPGVLSARYGGTEISFADKMAKLLAKLEETGDLKRRARFVSSIAIADSSGEILFTSEGVCCGQIALAASGSGGFGYDPIFIPDGFEKTFGELSEGIKQSISHRYRAIEQIMPFLRHFLSV